MAWLNASTVCSHSRFPLESSSTSRAFSSAMPACARTARVNISAPSSMAFARSPSIATAPMVRETATMGTPSQLADTGFSTVTSSSAARAATRSGNTSGPRRSASCSSGSSVVAGRGPLWYVTTRRFVSMSSSMTDSRAGASCSVSARATISTIVAGRNAPASSWDKAVSRIRMSATDPFILARPETASGRASPHRRAPRQI